MWILRHWQKITLFAVFLMVSIHNLFINWMLVDDGYDIWFVRIFSEKIYYLNFPSALGQLFEGVGRFRPVYWIYKWLVWLVGGNNAWVHHLVHMVVFASILFLIYYFAKKITSSNNAGLLSVLIFALTPLNHENWLRLGPTEPLVGLFTLLILFFIFKKKYFNAAVMISVVLLSKETAVAIIPGIIFLWLIKKRLFNGKSLVAINKITIYSIIIAVFVMFISLQMRQGYSAAYSFQENLLKNVLSYWKTLTNSLDPFLSIALISFIVRFGYEIKRKGLRSVDKVFILQSIFLFISVSFLVVQSPWEYVLERYLLPTLVFTSVFIGVELWCVFIILASLTGRIRLLVKIVNAGMLLLFVYFTTTGAIQLLFRTIETVVATRSAERMINHLSKAASINSYIYMNLEEGMQTVEYVEEIKLHLSEFKNRPDIDVKYIPDDFALENNFLVSGDIGKRMFDEDTLIARFGEPYVISEKGSVPIFTTPVGLIKQTTKKFYRLVRFKEKPDLEGIYTIYYSTHSWKIYKI